MPATLTSHTSHSKRHNALARVMRLLPLLPLKSSFEVDYEAADPDVLVEIAEQGELVLQHLAKGLRAVGSCLVYAANAVESEQDRIFVAELGRLTTELSELVSTLMPLVQACRYHTVDYEPDSHKALSPAHFSAR